MLDAKQAVGPLLTRWEQILHLSDRHDFWPVDRQRAPSWISTAEPSASTFWTQSAVGPYGRLTMNPSSVANGTIGVS